MVIPTSINVVYVLLKDDLHLNEKTMLIHIFFLKYILSMFSSKFLSTPDKETHNYLFPYFLCINFY